MLDEASIHHPDAWWWLKADGCDVVSGLAESTRGIWSGDVDLNDGDVERQYKKYQDRLLVIQNLQLKMQQTAKDYAFRWTILSTSQKRTWNSCIPVSLTKFLLQCDYYLLLHTYVALQEAQCTYEEKVMSTSKVPEKTLFKLAWQVQELEVLIKDVRKLVVNISALREKVQDEHYDLVKENTARKLGSIRTELMEAVKKLSRHQRNAATHIFVFMISPESRSRKPYALPVQCLPIRGLKDQQARELANKVIAAMVERNMKVAGTYTHA